MGNSVFENLGNMNVKPVASGMKNQPKRGPVAGYVYKDAKPTGDYDLDRIRTFIKTEINAEPNGDPDQVWYSVDIASNQREGRFLALKCHLGQKKQKTIKKAYSANELVAYFFSPICNDDFNGYSQYPETWAKRQQIWNQFYNPQAWRLHLNGGTPKQQSVDVETKARFKEAKKRAAEKRAAGERSVFENLTVEEPKDGPSDAIHVLMDGARKDIESKFKRYEKDLLSAIAHQMTKDVMYVDLYSNGVCTVINQINVDYLDDELKDDINGFDEYEDHLFNLTDKVEKMIEAVAKKIGTKTPVYRAGQWCNCEAEGTVTEDYYSTNKERVLEYVKSAVEDICKLNKDNIEELGFATYEEYLANEMSKVFCYRVY